MTMAQDNFDRFTDFEGLDICEDPLNKRLKIIDYASLSTSVIRRIVTYAKQNDLGKIVANCRREDQAFFEGCGFVAEGMIEGFFAGEDAVCISYFEDQQRRNAPCKLKEDLIIEYCINHPASFAGAKERDFLTRRAVPKDIPQMITLFKTVFETYPVPICNADYLKAMMGDQMIFMVAETNGKIVSIASADLDQKNKNAEITDCVTDPEYRGKNMLSQLIEKLEQELKQMRFLTAYSLSRAQNVGINKALSNLGYRYQGRRINNCHICGDFEDMNIWVKSLAH